VNPDHGTAGPQVAVTETAPAVEHAPVRSRVRLFLTVVSALAVTGAGLEALHHNRIAVGSLLLASVVSSGLASRGPGPVNRPFVLASSGVLFIAGTTAAAMAAITGYQQITDPDHLLLLAVFSMCALAAVFAVVASWLPGWRFREPAVLALLTLALGGLSLHGLTLVSSALTIPSINGSVLFYADQLHERPLYLNFNVTPSVTGIATSEFMDIVNPSTNNRPAPWAVLLTGDARLIHFTTRTPAVHERVLTRSYAATGVLALEPGQLAWGRLAPGQIAQITGQPRVSYTSSDATQTAVSLPDFDLGGFWNTDPVTLSAIARDLGTPLTSPGGLSISVDAGTVSPLDTVVTAIPPLTDPSALSWTFHTDTAPAYKLLNQSAQNSLNGYSFALAILLGAAGAGLLASIQAFVTTVTSRKETDRRIS
jgi:hypothetical protein